MITSIRLASVAVAASIALVACSPATDDPTTEPSSEPTVSTAQPSASAQPIADEPTVDPADAPDKLQFTATTLDGQAFEGTSIYGTPTILWFWASWCPVCQAEAPAIVAAIEQLPEGVQIIGVPGRSGQAEMEAFVAKYGLGDTVQIVDDDGRLWSNFGVASQPAVGLVDSDGSVRIIPGSVGTSALVEAAKDLT